MKRRSAEQGGSDPKRQRGPREGDTKSPDNGSKDNTSDKSKEPVATQAKDATAEEPVDEEPRNASASVDDRVGASARRDDQGDQSSTATSASSEGHVVEQGSSSRSGALVQRRAPSPEWVVSPSGSHLSKSFIERLQKFFTYADPPTKRYSLSNVPSGTSWGTGDWDRFWCEAREPVLVWLVCELSKDYFLCAPGRNPATNISASVGMLRDSDLERARRMLRDNQKYTGPEKSKKPNTDTIRLSRKTSSLSRTKQLITWLFEDIYDGRKEFGAKETLSRMLPDEIGSGDILLAECYLTRYHCDAEGKAVFEKPFEKLPWTRWRTGFEIQYLTLLRSGEDTAPTATPSVDDSKTARM